MTPDGQTMGDLPPPEPMDPPCTTEPLTIRDHTRTAIEYGCARGSLADLRAQLRQAHATNEALLEQIGTLRREVNALKIAAKDAA